MVRVLFFFSEHNLLLEWSAAVLSRVEGRVYQSHAKIDLVRETCVKMAPQPDNINDSFRSKANNKASQSIPNEAKYRTSAT